MVHILFILHVLVLAIARSAAETGVIIANRLESILKNHTIPFRNWQFYLQ